MTSDSPKHDIIDSAGVTARWIVLVHGVSQDRRLFCSQVDDFSRDFRLLLIDLHGHGLSSDIPGPFGVDEFAVAIHNAICQAGIQSPHFWGTHLGASAGLVLAFKQPSIFRSLVLEAPVFPGRRLPAVSELLIRISRIAKHQGIEAARRVWWNEGPWFEVIREHPKKCRAKQHREMISNFNGAPWLDTGLASRPIPPIDNQLSALRIPTLIINGEHDYSDFIQAATDLDALLPMGQMSLVDDGGGFPRWEFPARVNRIVSRFLQHVA